MYVGLMYGRAGEARLFNFIKKRQERLDKIGESIHAEHSWWVHSPSITSRPNHNTHI
jgi:hypothetical protein